MYHPLAGETCDYESYRAATLDKVSADRNYKLLFRSGSIAAISKLHMDHAQAVHGGRCHAIDLSSDTLTTENIPSLIGTVWADSYATGMPCAAGLDMASTTEKKSNPSSLTITQYINGVYYELFTLRFKVGEYNILRELLRYVLHALPWGALQELAVDTSNEKLAGSKLASDLNAPVVGYSGGQNVTLQGQAVKAKYAMGVSYVQAYEDRRLAIATPKWLADDRRSVQRNGDQFTAPVTAEGYHADTFDSGKLALWGLLNPSAPDFAPQPVARPAAQHWDDCTPAALPNNRDILARPF